MKKSIIGVLVLLCAFQSAFAKQVSESVARLVAVNQVQAHMAASYKSQVGVELVYSEELKATIQNSSYKNLEKYHAYYVFNVVGGDGFVMVSADDLLYPVLGYSTQGDFHKDHMPKALVKWLAGYRAQLTERINQNAQPSVELAKAWEQYQTGNFPAYKRKAAVSPLLTTQWDQAPYYNSECPYDRFEFKRAVTGCVATAMAQVMKYHAYPSRGVGYHSYSHPRYGTLSANFGNTEYNWSAMPNSLNGDNTELGTLMYHCGVAVEMNYSPSSSGAYVIKSDSRVCAEAAFEDYFGYDTDLRSVERVDYTGSQWVSLMKTELDGDRPVLYAGFGSGGGHAFVCDGYDNRSFFHMNWGWGGYQDGYFLLDALDPNGTGTGGGTGGYNSGQQAIIGVKPPAGSGGGGSPTPHDLRLYSSISVSTNPVTFLSSFTVNADVGNFGDNSFSGKFAAAIFDQNDQFVEFIEEFLVSDLPKNSHYTNGIDFSTDGLDAPPGNYNLAILYQSQGGSWTAVADGAYTNYVSLKIKGFDNDIQVYRDIEVTPEAIVNNESFEIWFDIVNRGLFSYTGTVSADLHNLDGEHVLTIDEIEVDDFQSGYHFTNGLTIKSSGIEVDPGTYYLVLWEVEDSETDWSIIGSDDKPNPIYVVVSEPGLKGDPYEDNNSKNEAYPITMNFVNDKALFKTNGTNIHETDDYDYFSVAFEEGYNYSMKARVHDVYEAGDGKEYTMDVLFSYDHGNGWSESFDTEMSGSALFQDGGEVYFFISPYFQGETGTYTFEIDVSRKLITNTSDITTPSIQLYPNPVVQYLYVESNEQPITSLVFVNSAGQEFVMSPQSNGQTFQIDVSKIPSGLYVVRLYGGSGVVGKEKVIINH